MRLIELNAEAKQLSNIIETLKKLGIDEEKPAPASTINTATNKTQLFNDENSQIAKMSYPRK